jgi:hypothetical protein
MPVAAWAGQYMQDPVSDEGAIIKREWWQDWPLDRPPSCDLVVQAWDTAYSDKPLVPFGPRCQVIAGRRSVSLKKCGPDRLNTATREMIDVGRCRTHGGSALEATAAE